MKPTPSEFQELQRKAEGGDKEAQFLLAEVYDVYDDWDPDGPSGDGGPPQAGCFHPAKALLWYQKSADQEYAPAQFKLSQIYSGDYCGYERLLETNETLGLSLLKKSAEQGYAPAQDELGGRYCEGYGGVDEDREVGLAILEKAATQGYTEAQTSLAEYLEEENPRRAFKWYMAAAESGNADAQWKVANYYAEGTVVPKSSREAFKWNLRAAEQGDESAITRIGECYITGVGVDQDSKEAIRWLIRIADPATKVYPVIRAQHLLTCAYMSIYTQSGSPDDVVEGYKWICLAVSYSGFRTKWEENYRSHLISERSLLEGKMTREQIERGQDLATAMFRPPPHD